ncbi:MAG: hypothetical protein LBU09_02350, partial [Endomicrobium sp.]|nr:hypothetical protein [Endomicrobium sp.]
MKKIMFSLFPIFFISISVFADQPVNYGNNVYALFSENFNGIKIDLDAWTGQTNNGNSTQTPNLNDRDRVAFIEWNGGGDLFGLVTERGVMDYSSSEARIEGNTFFRMETIQGGGWSGFGYQFRTSTDAIAKQDMSAYANGSIEFWARSSSPNVGNYKFGIKQNGYERMFSLSGLGFTPNGQWQKITIQFGTASFPNTWLTDVEAPLLVLTNNTTAIIDFDQIVWRKAGNPVSWDIKLMDVNTKQLSASSEITWTNLSSLGTWKVADQYFELKMDCIPDKNWGIQIFSNAKAAYASPEYTGASTDTAFGLINTIDTQIMLPMAWRITDKTLPFVGNGAYGSYNQTLELAYHNAGTYDGLYDSGTLSTGVNAPNPQNWMPWFFLKDRCQYASDTDLEADEYTKVWTNKGFHAAPSASDETYYGM